jgi:hypothetical protein
MVDGAVGVCQLVPEGNSGRDVGDLRGEHRPMLHRHAKRLADDFKLALNGGAQQRVRRVVFENACRW